MVVEPLVDELELLEELDELDELELLELDEPLSAIEPEVETVRVAPQ